MARWTAAHVLRRPGSWLWLVAIAAAWPAFLAFAPLSLTASQGQPRALLYEVVFLSLLAGHVAGRAVLDRFTWIFERAEPLRGLALEQVALAGAVLPFVAAGLAPAALGGELDGGDALALGARALAAHSLLGAISAVLARSGLAATARPAVLVGLTWVLPALCGGGPLGEMVLRDLGAASCLGAETVSDAWKGAASPIIGWLAAALLLQARPDVGPGGARP